MLNAAPRASLIAPTKWGNPRVRQDVINELNLVSAIACNEMGGGLVRDLLTGVPLIKNGGAVNGGATWGSSSAANIAGAVTNSLFPTSCYVCAAPSVLMVPWPISLFWRGALLGTPTTSSRICGMQNNTSESPPYLSWAFYWDGSVFQFGYNLGTTSLQTMSTGVGLPSVGVPFDLGFTHYITGDGLHRRLEVYFNGAVVNSTTILDTSEPAYSASASYGLSGVTTNSYNPNCVHDVMFVGRAPWRAEHFAALHRNPHMVFEQPGELQYVASPGLVPAGGGSTDTPVHATAGSVHLRGKVGVVTATANKQALATAGVVHLRGKVGVVLAPRKALATSGAVHLRGNVGTVHVGANTTVTATAGATHIRGKVGVVTVAANTSAIATAGSVHLRGKVGAVAISNNKTVQATAGRVHLRGQTGLVVANPAFSQWFDAGGFFTAPPGAEATRTFASAGSVHLRGQQGVVSYAGSAFATTGRIHVRGQTPFVFASINKFALASAGRVHIRGSHGTVFLDHFDFSSPFFVAGEDRNLVVGAEDRAMTVASETRTMAAA